MTRRPNAPSVSDLWPLALRLLIAAAERECPRGHAQAFAELTALALTRVPARGIFDPTIRGEHELFADVERIAARHLGMHRARIEWRRALQLIPTDGHDTQVRERVEEAAQRLQGVSDTAYFYTGLAFGLAASTLYGPGRR